MSPLPWKANGSDSSTATWVEDARGKRVCTMNKGEQDWANAQGIAMAVSKHDELVQSLRECLRVVDAFTDKGDRIFADNARALLAEIDRSPA